MTIFFRNLSKFTKEKNGSGVDIVKEAFYSSEEIQGEILEKWNTWFTFYRNRLKKERLSDEARKEKMNNVNPKYVLRNYMAQLAIESADKGNYSLIEELYQLLKKPYDEQPDNEKWFVKRPEWARHKVGCSMLSCSS